MGWNGERMGGDKLAEIADAQEAEKPDAMNTKIAM